MHHITHQWSRNWTLENRIAEKPGKCTPKSNQQRRNGTKHSCSHYCCYWRYCDKHDFMILVTIIAGKLKNIVQTHNKCEQAPNVQDNKRKYDFAKKRGGGVQMLQNMNRNIVWIKFQDIFANSCHRRHMFTITSSVSRAMQCKACKCSNAMARKTNQTQA